MLERIRIAETVIVDLSDWCYNSLPSQSQVYTFIISLCTNECDMEQFQLQVQLTLNRFLVWTTTHSF